MQDYILQAVADAEAVIGPFERFEPLSSHGKHANYVWNIGYCLEPGKFKTQLLKVYVHPERMPQELAALQRMRELEGLLVPDIIAYSRPGAPGWICLEEIPGKPLNPRNPVEMEAAVRAAACFHVAGFSNVQIVNRPFSIDRKIAVIIRKLVQIENDARQKEIREILARISALAGRHTHAEVCVHGDLYPHNIIVSPHCSKFRIVLLDWEHYGLGWAEGDLNTLFSGSPDWLTAELYQHYWFACRKNRNNDHNLRASMQRFNLLRALSAIRQATDSIVAGRDEDVYEKLLWVKEVTQ